MRTLLFIVLVAATLVVAPGASPGSGGDPAELAFVRAGTIYVAGADGTGERALTRGFTPQWSPDGQQIAFVRQAGGNSDVYVADADGTNVRRLTRARGGDVTPSWSPDGAQIAFASNRHGLYRIYVMRADGTRVRRVPMPPRAAGNSFLPAWSPSGRLIAFSSSAWTAENPEIYVVRPDGSGFRRLTRTAGDAEVLGDDSWPRWSPDGKRIVFSSNRTGNGEVWIMGANGKGQRRIAGLPRRDDWAPAFSPDGEWIAFSSLATGRDGDLYLVRPNGKGLRRLGLRGSDPVFRP